MDLSFLKYNFKSQIGLFSWLWIEIKFGLDNHIIKNEDVIDYAIYIFDDNILGYDNVLQITLLDKDENVYPYLKKLVDLEGVKDIRYIDDKWLYAILNWLYDNKDKYQDVLSIVEDIYEKFDYPNDIRSFVRYLPSTFGDLGSKELNRQKLFNNWEVYLKEYSYYKV